MSKNLWVTAGLLTSVLAQGWAQTESRQLSIDTKTLGIEISPTLSGIFFEDINQSLDGGICAQMIQNNLSRLLYSNEYANRELLEGWR